MCHLSKNLFLLLNFLWARGKGKCLLTDRTVFSVTVESSSRAQAGKFLVTYVAQPRFWDRHHQPVPWHFVLSKDTERDTRSRRWVRESSWCSSLWKSLFLNLFLHLLCPGYSSSHLLKFWKGGCHYNVNGKTKRGACENSPSSFYPVLRFFTCWFPYCNISEGVSTDRGYESERGRIATGSGLSKNMSEAFFITSLSKLLWCVRCSPGFETSAKQSMKIR